MRTRAVRVKRFDAASGFYRRGYEGTLTERESVVPIWRCGHIHKTATLADECAHMALHCDPGSLTAEEIESGRRHA